MAETEDEHRRQLRVVFLGDELLTGPGDPRALGWVGRVLSKTPRQDVDFHSYVLAVPEEGTEALSHRWDTESASRFGEQSENYLVIALNDRDLRAASSARARLNLANILDRASQRGIRPLVLGPLPTTDPGYNRSVAELNRAYRDVTERRAHRYVDAFTPLLNHQQFRDDLHAHQGRPGQAGYGLISWLVLHRGWYHFLDIPEPSVTD